MVELSVVIPVYGCRDCLPALHRRLTASIEPITPSYELIFVDDRSPDGSWPVLQELARADASVKAFRLSRNFGQHAAITAGLAQTQGRWAVVMDCDLQDPPEEIPRLYAKAQEGHDVVLCRRKRRRQSWLRRLAGHAYYRLRNVLVKGDMYTNYTNLSMISRKVVDAFLTLRDRDRQYLLIVDWLGFEHAVIEVEPDERHSGRSAYTPGQLIRVAVDGLFFQSTVLLRWIVYVGFLMAFLGVLLAGYAFVVYVGGRPLPRWTALPMLILLLTGFIIISTGVSGLYVGKIFDQVKGRPLYVIDSKVVDGVERSVPRELSEPIADGLEGEMVEAAGPPGSGEPGGGPP
jgi:glycosyltransferase involved in cell wall biosynthesis